MAMSERVFGEAALRKFAADLDRTSEAIKREVSRLPHEAAIRAVARAQAAYPVGPVHWREGRRVGGGTLRASVAQHQPRGATVTPAGGYVPAAVVRVMAPHVHFYEDGTGARRDPTRQNANRGAAPAHGTIFVDIVQDERTRMYQHAQAMLDRNREIG